MTGLFLDDSSFWVNLNPTQPDELVGEDIRKTTVGQIMLEADLAMKRDYSDYNNPCNGNIGKEFSSKLEKKQDSILSYLNNKYPDIGFDNTNLNFQPMTRHWIVPDTFDYHDDGNQIYVVGSTLKVLSEETDNLSTYSTRGIPNNTLTNELKIELQRLSVEYSKEARIVSDEIVTPYVIERINSDEKYSRLRTVYNSLGLATILKKNNQAYISTLQSVLTNNNEINIQDNPSWNPKDVWDQYMVSLTKGDYNCTIKEKEEQYQVDNVVYISQPYRIYSGGGVKFDTGEFLQSVKETGPLTVQEKNIVKEALSEKIVEESGKFYFGTNYGLIALTNQLIPVIIPSNEKTNTDPSDKGGIFNFLYQNLIYIGIISVVIIIGLLLVFRGGGGGDPYKY
jgi:hypothetical protein